MSVYKKKIIFSILILIICVGCTRQDVTTDKIANKIQSDEKIVLKWVIPGEKYKDSDRVFAEFNRQLQEVLPNTVVEFEIINKSEYKEKWDMMMATNEAVDLAWTGSLFIYDEEVRKGSFLAIDYLLQEHGQDMLSEIPEEVWQKQIIDNKTYSIPIYGSYCSENYALKVSKNLMDQYGDIKKIGLINQSNLHTTKECYDVFEEFLGNAQEAGDIGTGVSYQTVKRLANKGYEGIYGANSPFVFKYFENDLKIYNKYELESYQIHYKTMADWYEKGYIREDILKVSDPQADDGKVNGSVFYIGSYSPDTVIIDAMDNGYEMEIQPLDGYNYMAYGANINATVIPKTAKYPERAIKLLNLLNSQKGQELFRLLLNGFEGEHYIKINDNMIRRIKDGNNSYLYMLPQNVIGNKYHNFEYVPEEFKRLEVHSESALISPIMGFELDTKMIISELAQVDIIVDEYDDLLSCGISLEWEDMYQEFIGRMKKAGSDKIVGEIQKQVNVYYEQNSNTVKARQVVLNRVGSKLQHK